MINIHTPEEIRKIDSQSIEELGISGLQLMETAACNSASYITGILEEKSRINILCGSGNNGGDGFAIARHLCDRYEVKVFWIGEQSKMSDETKTNYNSLKKIGIKTEKIDEKTSLKKLIEKTDCILDAFLGIGADENLRGIVVPILEIIQSFEGLKIAIDNPSGLNASTGKAHKFAFKADYTLTMFAPKPGHYLEDGIEIAGRSIKIPIGTPENKFNYLNKIKLLEKDDIKILINKRKENSSKFDFGRLAIIAGSKAMSGAASMAANSAISSGCGLVHLATVFPNNIKQEVMTENLQASNNGFISFNNIDRIKKLTKKCDALAIGPGLGTEEETKKLVRQILKDNSDKATVIDADALDVIDINSKLNENYIITPHTGEMSKITQIDRKEIEENRLEITREWSRKLNCTILLKGKTSIISNGYETYFNNIGNSGMATAGSGDVLAGLIASFLAQGYTPLKSGIIGSLLHSIAGDNYIKTKNKYSLTATKLIEEIEYIKI